MKLAYVSSLGPCSGHCSNWRPEYASPEKGSSNSDRFGEADCQVCRSSLSNGGEFSALVSNCTVTLNQETYDRKAQLARTGNAPQATVDEVTRNLESAIRKRESAQAALQLATTGASPEERALAAAQVKQAEAALNQREVDVAELTIRALITAQITTRVAALGENFSAGAPLFSLIDTHNIWFTFNLREDLLGGLKIGDTFDVTVPAFKSQVIPVRVTMINVQGQYATWRATRATGDFDLRTFEVRAVPTQPVVGSRS
jgi:HlyD family secretion protein